MVLHTADAFFPMGARLTARAWLAGGDRPRMPAKPVGAPRNQEEIAGQLTVVEGVSNTFVSGVYA